MKYFIIIAALLCFISIFELPYGYYTFLRILVSFMALIIIVNEFRSRSFWLITFLLIFVIFNPVIPIYLYLKPFWLIIDIIVGLLFLYYFYTLIPKKKAEEPEIIDVKHQEIPKTRDRIIK
ncbi:hypothetical protein MKJ01_04070 [Chryseobacterium sp. SSA4.19]|uniref:DUF6804 family protein n=1 Tax=Chryseobacterium sp. SSA4.19 TaxID=2919915 RepID=UPI001F4D8F34|nr:DUF6804 family protein [Chryseobacterium sp. SSA4.19]MCJ8152939.1 hypothetical protein [Chryseobacterium sp. SSA4.19]